MAQPDPFEALTVAEAARLAGVPVGQIRQRLASGELLHEVGRRKGREIQLVRRVDLAELWPEVLPGRAKRPSGPSPGTASGPAPAQAPDLGSHEHEHEPEPEQPQPQSQARQVTGDPALARTHAFEVRLVALQSANDALNHQVQDLHFQRGDLKEQCGDLRGRLTLIEQERQASTAGLLLAQRRLLELEAAYPAQHQVWWQQPTAWGAACLAIVLGLGWTWQWTEARGARGQAEEQAEEQGRTLIGLLSDQALERERFAQELVGWQDSSTRLRDQLDQQRSASDQDRSALRQALEATEGRSQELRLELDGERRQAEAARASFSQRLEQNLVAQAEAQQALLDERATTLAALEGERLAASAERDRFSGELDLRERAARDREGALGAELEAARAATGELQAQMERQSTLDGERQARLEQALDQLAGLEARLRQEQAWRLLERAFGGLWPRAGKTPD